MPSENDRKGAIAEAVIAAEAIRRGIAVARPLSPERYDLIFDLGARLERVQCKWVCTKGSVIAVPLRTSRRTASGYDRTTYSAAEIDAVAAYCAETGDCYYLPMSAFAGRTAVQLRLHLPRNGQAKAINWATEYAFDATLQAVPGP